MFVIPSSEIFGRLTMKTRKGNFFLYQTDSMWPKKKTQENNTSVAAKAKQMEILRDRGTYSMGLPGTQ